MQSYNECLIFIYQCRVPVDRCFHLETVIPFQMLQNVVYVFSMYRNFTL